MKTFCTALLLLLNSIIHAQGNKAEPFLPDIFSRFPNVRDIAISPEGDEIYFSVQSYQDEVSIIAYIKKINDAWSNPAIASFSGKYFDIEPFLSSNGQRLYFSSNRPINESENKQKDFDIWYVQRENKNAEWSSPVNVGPPINSEENEFYPSIANNNNFYFTCDERGTKGKDDIFFSQWENGKYSEPISLSDSINSEGYEFNAFIAPDESYIIFTAYQREDGFGSGDLYISYKTSDGEWTKAKNLGAEVNSSKMDYCPFVDSKTNTLYFTSKRSEVNNLNTGYSSLPEFLNDMKKYENGLSRIYKTTLNK
jgi:tricorn protease-like protein